MTLQVRVCKRCGYEWALRKSLYGGEPVTCPHCGSPRWSQDRIIRQNTDKVGGKNG